MESQNWNLIIWKYMEGPRIVTSADVLYLRISPLKHCIVHPQTMPNHQSSAEYPPRRHHSICEIIADQFQKKNHII